MLGEWDLTAYNEQVEVLSSSVPEPDLSHFSASVSGTMSVSRLPNGNVLAEIRFDEMTHEDPSLHDGHDPSHHEHVFTRVFQTGGSNPDGTFGMIRTSNDGTVTARISVNSVSDNLLTGQRFLIICPIIDGNDLLLGVSGPFFLRRQGANLSPGESVNWTSFNADSRMGSTAFFGGLSMDRAFRLGSAAMTAASNDRDARRAFHVSREAILGAFDAAKDTIKDTFSGAKAELKSIRKSSPAIRDSAERAKDNLEDRKESLVERLEDRKDQHIDRLEEAKK